LEHQGQLRWVWPSLSPYAILSSAPSVRVEQRQAHTGAELMTQVLPSLKWT
jgi:hypothetical protein